MIGYRGALRFTHEPEVFRLELKAVRRVWDAGHANFHVMLPYVRTARELEACRALVAESGLLAPWLRALGAAALVDPSLHTDTRMHISNEITELLRGTHEDLYGSDGRERHERTAAAHDHQLPRMLEAVLVDPNLHTCAFTAKSTNCYSVRTSTRAQARSSPTDPARAPCRQQHARPNSHPLRRRRATSVSGTGASGGTPGEGRSRRRESSLVIGGLPQLRRWWFQRDARCPINILLNTVTAEVIRDRCRRLEHCQLHVPPGSLEAWSPSRSARSPYLTRPSLVLDSRAAIWTTDSASA